MKLWDLRTQRCVQSFSIHTDSVWTVDADPSFSQVFSGGRDKAVFCTDLETLHSTMVCQTEEPVLKLLRSPDESLWISTTSSALQHWEVESHLAKERAAHGHGRPSLHTVDHHLRRQSMWTGGAGDEADLQPLPLVKSPAAVLKGLPALVKCDFLENRRHVLAKDSAGCCSVWDVTSGKRVKDFGAVDFDEQRKVSSSLHPLFVNLFNLTFPPRIP